MPNGQRVKARQYIAYIRQTAFQSFDLEGGRGGSTWTSVTMPGPGLDFRIDGAYRIHPQQAALPPEEQRWILWFLGNGEVYEMMLNDFQAFSEATGMNMFLFNYRGVSLSTGASPSITWRVLFSFPRDSRVLTLPHPRSASG